VKRRQEALVIVERNGLKDQLASEAIQVYELLYQTHHVVSFIAAEMKELNANASVMRSKTIKGSSKKKPQFST